MKTPWHKNAVFYQIYPRSFKDSNGDGIGDIRGIIEKLDYLQDLGIDAVWLSPCFKSPNDDNGYDISNYSDIMDEFGTLADFKVLLSGLHERNIKLILDLVANHTSDEHPWFLEAKKSLDNPYRDYYIWRKTPPNNWGACFGGSAWELSPETNEYYLHLFSKKQPDLNWDNPKVRAEIAKICNFWLELGADGFRCDVITYIAKDFNTNNYTIGSRWAEFIAELRRESWDNYDAFFVGECCGANAKTVEKICGEGKLDAVISFDHLPWLKNFSVRKWKRRLSAWQKIPQNCLWAAYFENHDQQRSVSRFQTDAKTLAVALMFLRGVPFIYEGQELGMTNISLAEYEYRDIQSVNQIKASKNKAATLKSLAFRARDHARTPMQWTAEKNAGFSAGEPWMKVNPNYTDINVETEEKDENSVLNFYKKLLKVRKTYLDIITDGDFTLLKSRGKTLRYSRKLGYNEIVVECDFKRRAQSVFFKGEKII